MNKYINTDAIAISIESLIQFEIPTYNMSSFNIDKIFLIIIIILKPLIFSIYYKFIRTFHWCY